MYDIDAIVMNSQMTVKQTNETKFDCVEEKKVI